MSESISIFWFRRDLRLNDNHGLYNALQGEHSVLPIFIFDTNILEELKHNDDARVSFIYERLQGIQNQLKQRHKGMQVFHGKPIEVWQQIIQEYNVKEVFVNRDYEPYARERDKAVYELLKVNGIAMKGTKDQVIFEKDEVLTNQDKPYTVFTPYSKTWKSQLADDSFASYQSEELLANCLTIDTELPSLSSIGFMQSELKVPDYQLTDEIIDHYKENRNRPDLNGTTKLSPHLRFGSISVREVCRRIHNQSEALLNEMIWRDFYAQVLYHNPKVVTENFRQKYDAVQWRNNEDEFRLWCEGKTGFPIVDAGMRQLNQTGWMHNRVRMITASFLCKDLLVDWRWGEAYFAEKLLDFDLASNNGGWQWAAGTGTDAAPYFRIFNPESQLKKFDPNLDYVKKWVPEYGTDNYSEPMVNHKEARERCLATYKTALG